MTSPPYRDGRSALTGEPLLITGSRCICPNCFYVFSGQDAFDRHRRGRYEPYERRCRTLTEMAAVGLHVKDSGVIGRYARMARESGNTTPYTGSHASRVRSDRDGDDDPGGVRIAI